MKTHLILLAVALFGAGLNHGFAQLQSGSSSSQTATVWVYRSKAWLSSTRKFWVYANGKPICKLGNRRHCQVTIPSGSVTFTTKLAGISLVPKWRSALPLTLQAGQTYYLQADVKTKLLPLQAILPLTEVVPNGNKLEEIRQSKPEQALIHSEE